MLHPYSFFYIISYINNKLQQMQQRGANTLMKGLVKMKKRKNGKTRLMSLLIAFAFMLGSIAFPGGEITKPFSIPEAQAGPSDAWDLNNFITSVKISNSAGTEVSNGQFYVGDQYTFKITFAERLGSGGQFVYNGSGKLVYQLHEDIEVIEAVPQTQIRNANNTLVGYYTISMTGRVEVWFLDVDQLGAAIDENYIDHYSNVTLELGIKAKFGLNANANKQYFGANANITVITKPAADLTVNKSAGAYNNTDETVTYTITVNVTNGSVDNLVLNDEITLTAGSTVFNNTYASSITSVQYRVNGSGASGWTNTTMTWVGGKWQISLTGRTFNKGDKIEIRYTVGLSSILDAMGTAGTISRAEFSTTLKNKVTVTGRDAVNTTVLTKTDDTTTTIAKTFTITKTGALQNSSTEIKWTAVVGGDANTSLNGSTISDVLLAAQGHKITGGASGITVRASSSASGSSWTNVTPSITFTAGTGANSDSFSFAVPSGGFTGVTTVRRIEISYVTTRTGDYTQTTVNYENKVSILIGGKTYSKDATVKGAGPSTPAPSARPTTGPTGSPGPSAGPTGSPKPTTAPTKQPIVGVTCEKDSEWVYDAQGVATGIKYTMKLNVPAGNKGTVIYAADYLFISTTEALNINSLYTNGLSSSVAMKVYLQGFSAYTFGIEPPDANFKGVYSYDTSGYNNSYLTRFYFGNGSGNPNQSTTWAYDDARTVTITYTVPVTQTVRTWTTNQNSGTMEDYLANKSTDYWLANALLVLTTGDNDIGADNLITDYYPIKKSVSKMSVETGVYDYEVKMNWRPNHTSPSATRSPGYRGYSLFDSGKSAIFEDTFDENLEYVEGSFWVERLGNGTNNITTVARYGPYTAQKVDLVNVTGNKLTVDFSNQFMQFSAWGGSVGATGTTISSTAPGEWYVGNYRFIVHYQLRIKEGNDSYDPISKMKNTARVYSTNPKFSGGKWTSSAEVDYKPTAVKKDMYAADGISEFKNGSTAAVEIVINEDGKRLRPAGATPPEFTAIDTMSGSLAFYLNSIKFFTKTSDGNGGWTDGWVEVPVANHPNLWSINSISANRVEFKIPDEQPVKIVYTALITAAVGETTQFKNEINVCGYIDSYESGSFKVQETSGGANASKVDLRLYKEDAYAAIKEHLSGAEFDLYINITGNGYWQEGEESRLIVQGGKNFYYLTSATEEAQYYLFEDPLLTNTFKSLFLIVETKAPNGAYVLPEAPDNYTFFVIHSLSESEKAGLETAFGKTLHITSDNIRVENSLPGTPEPGATETPEPTIEPTLEPTLEPSNTPEPEPTGTPEPSSAPDLGSLTLTKDVVGNPWLPDEEFAFVVEFDGDDLSGIDITGDSAEFTKAPLADNIWIGKLTFGKRFVKFVNIPKGTEYKITESGIADGSSTYNALPFKDGVAEGIIGDTEEKLDVEVNFLNAEYDVAIKKWVSEVTRGEEPVGTYTEPVSGAVTAPVVKIGDKVEFAIRVYNQTSLPTWVTTIWDYMPAGYTFDKADNADWELLPSGILNYTGEALRLSATDYKGTATDYSDVSNAATLKVILTVSAAAENGVNLKNCAEIREICADDSDEEYEMGDVVVDKDSKPYDDDKYTHDDNCGNEIDNEIDQNSYDEEDNDKDDHDFADVVLESAEATGTPEPEATGTPEPAPTGTPEPSTGGSLTLTKEVEGNPWLDHEEFDFVVEFDGDDDLSGITADGGFTSDDNGKTWNIKLTFGKRSVKFVNIPKGTEYTITEPDVVDGTSIYNAFPFTDGVATGIIGDTEENLDVEVNFVNAEYDVAIKKWVSEVKRGGSSVNTYREPASGAVASPKVKVGDTIEFSIRVYNQTSLATWVTKIWDYMPDGYDFDASENTDWIEMSDGTLNYIGDPILLGGTTYSGATTVYTDGDNAATLKVILTVNADAVSGQNLKNCAEVREITADDSDDGDEPGTVVKDKDSTPYDDDDHNHDDECDDETDNEIDENGDNGGDKDDHDFAEVELEDGPTGSLTLTKDVVGNPWLPEEEFDFVVEFDGDGDLSAIEVTDDSAEFTTEDGGSTWTGKLTFDNRYVKFVVIPEGIVYTITEPDVADGTSIYNGFPFEDGVATGIIGDTEETLNVEVDFLNAMYDVAIKKWVSEVIRGEEVVSSFDEPTEPSDAVKARIGDKVAFSIRVYNQSSLATWVTSIWDYMPSGYDFEASDNADWEMMADGTLNYVGVPIFLGGTSYEGASTVYADGDNAATLTMILTLNGEVVVGEVLRNCAEVREITSDDDGEPGRAVGDKDSTPYDDDENPHDDDKETDNEIDEDGDNGGDKDDHDFADVEIEPEPTTLKVGKEVLGNDYYEGSFAFVVTFDGEEETIALITADNDSFISEDGGFTWNGTLKHGEEVIFSNVAIGTEYEVSEESGDDFHKSVAGSSQGTINKATEVLFTNTYIVPTTGLTLIKTVEGDNPPSDDVFKFTVTFEAGDEVYSDYMNAITASGDDDCDFASEDGGFTWTGMLKHGGSVNFANIPYRTSYTISEEATDYYVEGGTDNKEGTLYFEGVTVVFVNRYEKPTPEPSATPDPTATPGPTRDVVTNPTNPPVPTTPPTTNPTDDPTDDPNPTTNPTNGPTDEPISTDGPTDEPISTDGPTDEPISTYGPTDEPYDEEDDDDDYDDEEEFEEFEEEESNKPIIVREEHLPENFVLYDEENGIYVMLDDDLNPLGYFTVESYDPETGEIEWLELDPDDFPLGGFEFKDNPVTSDSKPLGEIPQTLMLLAAIVMLARMRKRLAA